MTSRPHIRRRASTDTLAPLATDRGFYLIGGTALALHLHHRTSTDLDFFLHAHFEPDDIEHDIARTGLRYVVTTLEADTLNLVCEDVPVQFLSDSAQRQIVEPILTGPARVAGIPDICAMKLNAVRRRAKLRDYYDLMVIDTNVPLRIEHGLQIFIERYAPAVPEQVLSEIVRALGYLDDVEDDPTVPVERLELEQFWMGRQPQLIERLSRSGPFAPLTSSRP